MIHVAIADRFDICRVGFFFEGVKTELHYKYPQSLGKMHFIPRHFGVI
jgi:hypothetical protein